MPGVEILDTTVHYVREFNIIALLDPAIILGVLGFIFCFLDGDVFDGMEGLAIGLTAGLFLGTALILITSKKTDQVDYIEYNVTISDEVNFNEFNDKYEIIDQQGKFIL